MESRAYAFLAGIFLVVLTAAAVIAGLWLGEDTTATEPYVVVSRQDVSGLRTHSTVTYRGVEAGKVEAIRFNRENPREILIDVRLRADIPVTRDAHAVLRPQGITGLSEIALKDPGGTAEPLPTSEADPARIPMRRSRLERFGSRGEVLLERATAVARRLEKLLGEKNRERFSAILANLERATADLSRLERRLGDALETVPEAGRRTAEAMAGIERLVRDDLRRETVPRLNAALDRLESAAASLDRLARGLKRNPQQLLLGDRPPPPGPGEPGFRSDER